MTFQELMNSFHFEKNESLGNTAVYKRLLEAIKSNRVMLGRISDMELPFNRNIKGNAC